MPSRLATRFLAVLCLLPSLLGAQEPLPSHRDRIGSVSALYSGRHDLLDRPDREIESTEVGLTLLPWIEFEGLGR